MSSTLLKKIVLIGLLFTSGTALAVAAEKAENTDLLVVAAENHLLQYYEDGQYKGPTQALLSESSLTAASKFQRTPKYQYLLKK